LPGAQGAGSEAELAVPALAHKYNVAGYIVKDGPGQNLVEVISMLGLYCQMVAAA
jgi:hypothetical protein